MDGLASALVESHREDLMPATRGELFFKMTGSGNDFVVFQTEGGRAPELENPDAIRRLTGRGTGVGADGVLFLEAAGKGDVRMRY